MKHYDFLDDKEKMRDFFVISKEEFLFSYSYLDEEEYNLTKERARLLRLKPSDYWFKIPYVSSYGMPYGQPYESPYGK